jgi:hypothetical protein
MASKRERTTINWDLKVAIIQKFGSQVHAARALGIRESRLSYLVRGHVQPSRVERELLENCFGSALVDRLFFREQVSAERMKERKSERQDNKAKRIRR